MDMCIRERLSKRATGNVFLDNYVLDFLDVPETVSEYNLKLIDKKLLQKKLKEYIQLAETDKP